MRLLIDTQILLWTIYQPEKLSSVVRERLCDRGNDIFFSTVSIAEIAIKSSLRRPDFSFKADEVAQAARDMAFLALALDVQHSIRLASLPWLHRDPFDRLLVSQAIEDGMRFVTADCLLAAYSDQVETL